MASIMKNERVEVLLKQRTATVVEVTDLSKTLRRIKLQGNDLEGFHYDVLAPEAHVKLFFPNASNNELRMPEVLNAGRGADWKGAGEGRFSPFRDYTIRAFDAGALTVDIDFVLHDDGVGGPWAKQVEVGQLLGIFGPRSFKFPPLNASNYLFLVDETSLPALARWLEILPQETTINAWIEVASVESEIPLPQHAGAKIQWLYSQSNECHGHTLIKAADSIADELVNESTWVWGATEAHTIVKLKRKLIEDGRFNPAHLDLTAYWKHD
jgi:NADPH-dependent ferric siderophore reductase